MATTFIESFDHYGGEPRNSLGSFGRAQFKTSDECHFLAPGIDVSVDRLASGKWQLIVNGVVMIFDRRPEFTIPQK